MIKLVVWDLDETFWHGVLSEHTAVIIPENIDLIKNMTNAGVINSICSKNDSIDVEHFMKTNNIWDYFVFPSINWSPKGDRVRQIIQEMNLRPNNVLFIDDNPTNIAEVSSACTNILVSDERILPNLRDYFQLVPKNDLSHERLNQYKVLEKKQAFKAKSGSNLEFLYNCNIRVDIRYNCKDHLDRIADLVLRSNQLNFTKIRSTKDELASLFEDPDADCGFIQVHDNFGDYGIVGFFSKKGNTLKHFVFSCRVLSMGIEQYVYHAIGRPQLTIKGEVASSLDEAYPEWINQNTDRSKVVEKSTANGKILIKGQCDMQQLFSFISETKNILTEFVYVNNKGISIEQGNHSVHIVESQTLSDEIKDRLIGMLPFGDKGMFRTSIFDKDIQWILLSTLSEGNMGIYREKDTGALFAFGEYTNDLTDTEKWSDLIDNRVFTANCDFSVDSLRSIRERFTFLGRLQPEQVIHNLDYIFNHISPEANLVLCLGSELPYDNNKQPAYMDRHIYHSELNRCIRIWASGKNRVFLLDTNKYVTSQTDYTNNINHFSKEVYHKMAQDFLQIVNSHGERVLSNATPSELRKRVLLRKIKKIPNRIMRFLNGK